MNKLDFIDLLTHKLNTAPLPGEKAQMIMRPASRDRYDIFNSSNLNFKKAAVLILLHKISNNWNFFLIERTISKDRHSGQIALPGGKTDKNEQLKTTALRECEEEIGVPSNSITIIGKLTELPIPVSKFIVTPFIGKIKSIPKLLKNDREVKSIFHVSIESLIAKESTQKEIRVFDKNEYEIPFFYLNNQKVWGATAMILSEFKELVKGS
jgi:8-oxo-dGTP pyrophosphatase MutT (NUDIX family)